MKTKIKNILGEILGYVIFTVILAAIMIVWVLLDEFVCNMDYVYEVLMMALVGVLIYTQEIKPKLSKKNSQTEEEI